ncbi:MAG: PD-(D/E)XK nuclease family protein [Bacteroidetes bacterium]|nr:PD-(D/E)XK nuclease family protein [Bacteroidota bacterium]
MGETNPANDTRSYERTGLQISPTGIGIRLYVLYSAQATGRYTSCSARTSFGEYILENFPEIISSIRIPFSGEPLKGLQVMGFLETRVLDFENVILLSVNEDVLPAGGNSPSFIPFNIRKAFGLPTFEEQHAVSAFHFYRLLQRAKNIFLLHNTEAKALTAGERSRFLLQIEHELQRKYPDTVKITRKVITTPIRKIEGKEISIAKDEAVLKELGRFVGNASSDAKSKLSASGLQSYISCSLRFYFRYLAGISEPEEMEENMEAATLESPS